MLIQIPNVLSDTQLAGCQRELAAVAWADGRHSAGYLSQQVKHNQQLPDEHPLGRKLGEMILQALHTNPQFMAAALPQKILPPLFNKYEGGGSYGRHIDGAIRPLAGTPLRVRTDLSATLFLSDPQSYDGGELVINDTFGQRQIKLAAGAMVLYPGTSVHQVLPVTRGVRLASFFWIQSMVREDQKRVLLYELDTAIQKVSAAFGEQAAASPATELAGVYHNLLRLWADV
jgi:PKHD-type hydroxylase